MKGNFSILRTVTLSLALLVGHTWSSHAQITNVNTGTGANTGNGDPVRTAFIKLNSNDVYLATGITGNSNAVRSVSTNYSATLANATNLTTYGLANAEYLDFQKGKLEGTYTNYNRYAWANTYNAIASRPFRMLRVGDGLAAGGHLAAATYRNLTNLYPVVGYMNSSFSLGEWQFGVSGPTGAAIQDNGQYIWWYKSYAKLETTNDIVTFTNQSGGAMADTFTVVTMDKPAAAVMNVQTQINGGTWTSVSGLSAQSTVAGANTVTVRTFTGPRAPTNIRVVDVFGEIFVLDASAIDSTATNGVIIGDYFGITSATMAQMRPSDDNITNAFTSWAPDMILFQKIGIGDSPAPGTYTTTNFDQFFEFIHATLPNVDVVFASQYPLTTNVAGYNSDNEGITNTLKMLSTARRYGWSLFDGHSPFIDGQAMQNRGWIQSDQIHQTGSGYLAYDSLLTHWLDLGRWGAGTNTMLIGKVPATNIFGGGTIPQAVLPGVVLTNGYSGTVAFAAGVTNNSAGGFNGNGAGLTNIWVRTPIRGGTIVGGATIATGNTYTPVDCLGSPNATENLNRQSLAPVGGYLTNMHVWASPAWPANTNLSLTIKTNSGLSATGTASPLTCTLNPAGGSTYTNSGTTSLILPVSQPTNGFLWGMNLNFTSGGSSTVQLNWYVEWVHQTP